MTAISTVSTTTSSSLLVTALGISALIKTVLVTYRVHTRVQRAYARIDEINAGDPRVPPQELEYGQRMTKTLHKYDENATDAVKMACRGQHVARWKIPRSEFPEGKAGYLKWRKTLYAMHAELMREVLTNIGGFTSQEIDKVARLVGKQWDLKNDPEANAVEDVAALVFLEYYFPSFSDKLNETDKMVDIVRKTWAKMSARGREAALKLPLPTSQAEIVGRALSGALAPTQSAEGE